MRRELPPNIASLGKIILTAHKAKDGRRIEGFAAAYTKLLIALMEGRSTLLILDDVHLADEASIMVLESLCGAQHTGNLNASIIATRRGPGCAASKSSDDVQHALHVSVPESLTLHPLRPLSRGEVSQLACRILSCTSVSEDLLDALMGRLAPNLMPSSPITTIKTRHPNFRPFLYLL